jgi:hypothetical protein
MRNCLVFGLELLAGKVVVAVFDRASKPVIPPTLRRDLAMSEAHVVARATQLEVLEQLRGVVSS